MTAHDDDRLQAVEDVMAVVWTIIAVSLFLVLR